MLNRCVIISPALASANNGNWHTARRWQHYATKTLPVYIAASQDFQLSSHQSPTIAIALHAFRSAHAIEQISKAAIPVAVVLTGTDIYRDIQTKSEAIASLELADFLVVLNEQGLQELPAKYRAKARCVFQSAPTRAPLKPRKNVVDFAFVGHIRGEKDPLTPIRALNLCGESQFRLRIAGDAHPCAGELVHEVSKLAACDARVEMLGALAHAQARNLIARSQALILSSVMEGGANVLIEAVTCGRPVLASKVPGNVGMLGHDYPGYFHLGDAKALAALMQKIVNDRQFYEQLCQACARRAPLFAPKQEAAGVLHLVDNLVELANKKA